MTIGFAVNETRRDTDHKGTVRPRRDREIMGGQRDYGGTYYPQRDRQFTMERQRDHDPDTVCFVVVWLLTAPAIC